MSAYATKQDVEEIVGKAVDRAVTDLSEIIANFAQQVDYRFNGVESRLGKVEQEITELRESYQRWLLF